MRRPAAPLAPSDPGLDVDLDAMYAAELPPCELTIEGRKCSAPSVAVVSARCLRCGLGRKTAVCGPCRQEMRTQAARGGGYFECADCSGLIVVGGLS